MLTVDVMSSHLVKKEKAKRDLRSRLAKHDGELSKEAHVWCKQVTFGNQVDAETKGDLSSRSLLSEFKSGHDLEWCCLGQEESRLRSSGVPRLRLT
ncbi:hypothetical protein PIB30_107094 [Stylosanthes scabra]|uniref:Uncharacterized protein n=1 Tax=Stylosanthes scabra TaxID=79078 RepID=A0ABU6TZH9_9FABA|nr:hypothetical protein [Stylosanthes scabra]